MQIAAATGAPGLIQASTARADLEQAQGKDKQDPLTEALDASVQRYDKEAVKLGVQLQGQQKWQMRQERRSGRYTTCLGEIAVVGK